MPSDDPVPDAEIELVLPIASVAITPLSWIAVEESGEADWMVKVTLASVPLPNMLVLIPYATQFIAVLLLLKQLTLLPAAVAAGPAVTATLEMSADE
jgi:hypothetical protein